jgi:two-component system, NtrC family, sensor kinase
MRLTRTIAFRLFLIITIVQTVIVFALTFAVVQIQRDSLMEAVALNAVQVNDIIARATRYSMLLNRKEDVHEIIRAMGGEPGIDGVRVYNKLGVVVFGTKAEEIGTKVDLTAEACNVCHTGTELRTPGTQEVTRIFTRPDGLRVLGMIRPIRNEEQCSNADCHAHPASKTILGVLDAQMSLSAVDLHLAAAMKQYVLFSAIAVILVGIVSGAFIWFVVRRPVKKLIVGMEMIGLGRLDHRLDASSSDELGRLAGRFNTMAEEVAQARSEITSWSQTLEEKVRQKTADLERVHKQMAHVEKMASLGTLASSVAHELNNPLEGILTFAKLLAKRVQKLSLTPEEKETMTGELRLIAEEAARSGNIVKNLLVFSRQKAVAFQIVHFRAILDRCVMLVNHHATMNSVTLQSACPADDLLECDPGQIQQLLVALMMNAIEAMPPGVDGRGGKLRVEAERQEGGRFLLRVADTGHGIPEDVRAHIFEPFFTTKSEGKGVGLGLAIAYGIVERHRGMIEVESTPGKGTIFIVSLPVQQPGPATAQEGVIP